MNTLKLRSGLLAVERIGKSQNKSIDGFYALPEESSSVGIVRYAAEDLSNYLGKKIYFGSKREEVRALGKDLIFMEKDNVFAEVSDEESIASQGPTK